MKRPTLAALAPLTLALCGAAHAQSSLTLSGNIDVGVYRDTAQRWNVGPIQRSNIALSGLEDLGDGWSATFRLSHRFDTSTGTLEDDGSGKPFWYDESTVGLKGPIGTLRLGRALDAIYAQDWLFDPWANFDRVASPAWDLWHTLYPSDPHGNSGRADYGRLGQGVFYDSPTLGGFALHVSASPQTQAGDANKPAAMSVTYSADGLTAMVSHAKNSASATDTFLGLRGDIAGLTLMAAYDRSALGADVARATTFGAQYPVGRLTYKLGWGTLRVNGQETQRTLGGGAVYALSKRTSLYADVARKRYVADAATVMGLGVMHSF